MPISTHPGPPGGAQGPPMSLVRHSTRETAHCPSTLPAELGWVTHIPEGGKTPDKHCQRVAWNLGGDTSLLPAASGTISSWPLAHFSASVSTSPLHWRSLACLRSNLAFGVTVPGFHRDPGPGAESCYLPRGVRMSEGGRDPGLTLSAPCLHQLILASLPSDMREELRGGGYRQRLILNLVWAP